MEEYTFSEDCEKWFADVIARLFELSAKSGYDSEQIVNTMLTNPLWISMLLSKNVHYYCTGYTYTLNHIVETGNVQKGNTYNPYVMWSYGYLIKWWAYKFPQDIGDILTVLPLSLFETGFDYWHTQGWNKSVDTLHSKVLELQS